MNFGLFDKIEKFTEKITKKEDAVDFSDFM